MTRFLVTGATGFIGRHLVAHLAAAGFPLTLLVKEAYGSGQPLPPPLAALRERFDLVYADLRSFNLTVRAVREAEPDLVIHLAAVGAAEPFLPIETALRHNVTGTINLARACFEKNRHASRLLVARTPGERTHLNIYAASKLAAWDFCRTLANLHGWPIAGAMIFQCYGPGQPDHLLVPAAVRAALAGEDFPMTSGEQARDWIYVDDVVRGLRAAAESPTLPAGTTVDLGTGQATRVVDVVRLIYELSGSAGRPLPGALPDRPGEVERQQADAEGTESRIGWRAAVSLREGLVRMLAAAGG